MNQLKIRNNIMLGLLVLLLTFIPFAKTFADQYYPAGGGGSGGLTSVGLQGDGVLISTTVANSPLTSNGTLGPLALANAAGGTIFANATSGSAAPAYVYGAIGTPVVTAGLATPTLTATSSSYQIANGAAGNVTYTLPAASACPGKVFWFFRQTSSAGTITIQRAGSDGITGDAGLNSTSVTLPGTVQAQYPLGLVSDGSATWNSIGYPNTALGLNFGGTGNTITATAGAVAFSGASVIGLTAAGTTGQIFQSAGSGTPTWTSTPGSGTALTSLTSIKDNSAGTSPSISDGGTSGSGGTTAFVGTAHDESGQFSVTAGSAATACVVTVTFGTAAYSAAPNVIFSPASSAAITILSQIYVSSQATGSFAITLGALSPGGVYTLNYHVKQ